MCCFAIQFSIRFLEISKSKKDVVLLYAVVERHKVSEFLNQILDSKIASRETKNIHILGKLKLFVSTISIQVCFRFKTEIE